MGNSSQNLESNDIVKLGDPDGRLGNERLVEPTKGPSSKTTDIFAGHDVGRGNIHPTMRREGFKVVTKAVKAAKEDVALKLPGL
ncbi:hypothetical protein AGR13a_Lc30054 [Agrobacterium genomosp. 13 str. CFBP 6927]|uniref:Uncharacterized protein n=1 Tax=Agrobacterium genomosp. 13 str. CFBP 6927 TaxID=1183428 RepID=A0ABP2BQC7_9HYPH|nr:hypothetical protein AGR13a_Lc30054 [Agrobacterium genomosp. 13 str. CFBP 6927]